MKINAKKLVSTKDMDRKEWLQWRQKGFGGSDIAGLLDMNPKYTSPLRVYLSKVEPVEEGETSEAATWGNILEPVIRQKFKGNHPELTVRQSHFMWCHPDHEFMTANVDGFIHDSEKGWGVLEIKTASEYLLKKWSDDDGLVPEEYLLQAQHYLAVLGLQWGFFAVLIGGNKYKEFYFERDEELVQYLITLENDFWFNHIVPEIPPDLDGSDASKKILESMYPVENVAPEDEVVTLDAEAGKLLEQLDKAKEQIKLIEVQKDEAENKLKQYLGERQIGLFFDRKITWKSTAKTSLDTKAIKKDHPDIYEKYARKTEYRKFLA